MSRFETNVNEKISDAREPFVAGTFVCAEEKLDGFVGRWKRDCGAFVGVVDLFLKTINEMKKKGDPNRFGHKVRGMIATLFLKTHT